MTGMLKRAKRLMRVVKLFSPSKKPETSSTHFSSSHACHSHHRLITVGYSHYCEKARFALSLSSLREDFIEEQHLPVFHVPFTLDLRKARRYPETPKQYHAYDYLKITENNKKEKLSAKELTGVPKLCMNVHINKDDDNNNSVNRESTNATLQSPVVVANGSDGIMRYLYHHDVACKHFYPTNIKEEVEELESYLNTKLGPAATDWAFSKMLITSSNPPERNAQSQDYFLSELTRLDSKKNSLLETLLFKVFGKSTFFPLMIENNGVNEENGKLAKDMITDVFDKIDTILSDRQSVSTCPSTYVTSNSSSDHMKENFRYLFGTVKPTAADITLATLATPILLLDATKDNFPTADSMMSYIKQHSTSRNYLAKCEGMIEMVNFAAEMRLTRTGRYLCCKFMWTEHNF